MEESAKSVMDLTQHFSRLLDDARPLINTTKASLNESNVTTKGISKSQDYLLTGSKMSRNVEAVMSNKDSDGSDRNTNKVELKRNAKRPNSMAAALTFLYDQYESRLRMKKEDEKDYDEVWPSSLLLQYKPADDSSAAYCQTCPRVAHGSEVSAIETSLDCSSTSEKCPLIEDIYDEMECAAMPPDINIERRTSILFYANPGKMNFENYLMDENGGPLNSSSLLVSEKQSKSQLPRNALLQYFGKTAIRPEEMAKMDLTRPTRELTDSSLSIRGKMLFVLMRILEDELILEGRIKTANKESLSPRQSFSRVKKRLSVEKKKTSKKSPEKELMRKWSSPDITASPKLRERNSIINLRADEVEVGEYDEVGKRFPPMYNGLRKSSKRSGLCTDILLCLGCRSNESTTSIMDKDSPQTLTLSTPVQGNEIIESFELKRIVYCGTEYAEKLGVSLITWLYQSAYAEEHIVECHVAACDDFQHAKSLATSLGEAIRKVVAEK